MANYNKLKVSWKNNLSNIYKETTIIGVGQEASININLDIVSNIYVNFEVNGVIYTDLVEINGNIINVPFKTDVLKKGEHKLELTAYLKNGDVIPSHTYTYYVEKSIINPSDLTAQTEYPILIRLLEEIEKTMEDEEKRKIEEAKRVEAEISRQKNENNRTFNEQERINAESNRIKQEIIRKDNEEQRVKEEIERVTVETIRQNNEEQRKINENDRINKESTRHNNEEQRNNIFNAIVDDYNVHLLNEQQRESNEEQRKINENDRVVKENIRLENESTRQFNEQNRIDNFNQMQVVLNDKLNEVEEFKNDTNVIVKDFKNDINTEVEEQNTKINTHSSKLDNHEARIKTNEGYTRTNAILIDALWNIGDGEVLKIHNEEGNVLSLIESKYGALTVDELQGNTLVNYCTNGSEELTLNNEINVQGTNITLTDTVDNSKVDVVCEGNTLVNLLHSSMSSFDRDNTTGGGSGWYNAKNIQLIKPSTVYTIISNITINTGSEVIINNNETSASCFGDLIRYSANEVGMKIVKVTSKSDLSNATCIIRPYTYRVGRAVGTIMVIEGDYTNKPIPSYFEGMKSAFELEDNKVEIVGQSKNLFNSNNLYKDNLYISNGVEHGATHMMTYEFDILPNTNYCYNNNENKSAYINLYNDDEFIIGLAGKSFNSNNCNKVRLSVFKDSTWHQLEEGSVATSYVPYATNTHSIQLSEPLRGLPNGVCDKFVKQGGKWYIERNCGELVLDGSQDCSISGSNGMFPSILRLWVKNISDLKNYGEILCDKLPIVASKDYPSIVCANGLDVHLPLSNDTSLEVAKQWLSENPIKVVYTLVTPTYEEITDPQVITYLDTTHISTNSTIPCNMQVKNSGYNAIIKPSTQYTVAFDIDTSGEVGINLGGAKVTTTNNVATITTPSTLIDDSLRLYGKGIKASNVRLLEGDKTNCVPSYFEGMKSCFEDKEQDNGSYGVEILSNNKNLIKNGENYKNWDGYTPYQKLENGFVLEYSVERIAQNKFALSNLKHGETYTFSCDVELLIPLKRTFQVYRFGDNIQAYGTFTATSGKFVYTFKHDNSMPSIGVYFQGDEHTTAKANITNIQIEKGNEATDYVPHKSNSIQLQLNEPLRAVGDVKDRFVFKDGKLMIERNCGEVVLNGNENYWQGCSYSYVDNIKYLRFYTNNDIGVMAYSTLLCDNFNSSNESKGNSVFMNSVDGSFPNGIQFQIHPSSGCIDNNMNSWKQWLQNNPTTVAYQLKEPTYEEIPYELQKLILVCYENGTLFIDTLIPPTVSVTYSANIPVISALNEQTVIQDQQDAMILENTVAIAMMNLME